MSNSLTLKAVNEKLVAKIEKLERRLNHQARQIQVLEEHVQSATRQFQGYGLRFEDLEKVAREAHARVTGLLGEIRERSILERFPKTGPHDAAGRRKKVPHP